MFLLLLLLLCNFCFVSYIIYTKFLFYFMLIMISIVNVCSLVYIINRHYLLDTKITLYYLERCYYSQQLLSIWHYITSIFPDFDYELVECSDKTFEFFTILDLQSFPTLCLQHKNTKYTLTNNMTYGNIIEFIQEKIE